MPELWYVVVVDTPEGKRIGIDQESSGIDFLDTLSDPMSYEEAIELCNNLSNQLNIKKVDN